MASTLEFLVFVLDSQRYAVEITCVREVVRAVRMAPLPRAPDVVEGLVNLRGELIPVLDLRRRFRLARRPVSPLDHLVVARTSSRTVAFRVDRAEGLVTVSADQLDAAPADLPGVGLVAGALKLEDGLVLLHDLERFLSEAEALQLDTALTSGPPDGEQRA